jgi:hypothetical protein
MIRRFLPLLLLSTPALAIDDIDWGGNIWANHLRSSEHFLKQYTEQNSGLFIFGKKNLTDSISAKAEIISYHIKSPLLYMPDKDLDNGEIFTEINELNVSYIEEGLTLKAGQITTSWGTADGLNPTDFLTGKRNVLLLPEDQLTRRGHTSLMLEWLPEGGSSPWSFEQWIVPLHSRTDVLLNQELTQGVVSLKNNERAPRVEFATKVAYSGQGFELEYIYFNGVNKTPIFTEASRKVFPTFHLSLRPKYAHQESHGVNLTKDLEWSVVRMEAAYTKRNEVLEGGDYIKDPGRIDLVAGIEKSFFQDHRFNFQGVLHHYPSFEENDSGDLITAQVRNMNKYLLAQHNQTRIGYLFVYNFEPNSLNQLKFKCTWLNYFHDEGARFLFPQIDYLITDNLKVQTFAMIFSGGNNTPFGTLEKLSSVAVGGRYEF